LASEVRKGQLAGLIAVTRDPAAEGALLLALTNGLTSSVLAGQRGAEQAAEFLEYHLNQLFGAQGSPPS
jgi:hypothetical protein